MRRGIRWHLFQVQLVSIVHRWRSRSSSRPTAARPATSVFRAWTLRSAS